MSDPIKNAEGQLDVDAMLVAGWHYRDIGWTTLEWWQKVMELIGPDAIMLAGSTMPRGPDGVVCSRGQFLISPDSMTALRASQGLDADGNRQAQP